jgi:gamma-glutamyltranspeptidase/glutathione hydrolase
MPDEVRVETGFPEQTLESLRALGHVVRAPMAQTSVNSVALQGELMAGAPDPRTRGGRASAP